MSIATWQKIGLAFALCAFTASCGGDDSTESGGDAGTDTDTDADADSDSDSDSDSGAGGYEDEDSLMKPGVGGFLSMGAGHLGGDVVGFHATVNFFDLPDDYGESMWTEVLIPAEGEDTCELAYLNGSGAGSTDVDWLTAGVVTLTSGPDGAVLPEYEGGLYVGYSADLLELGLDPRYGEGYSLSVSGDETPAEVFDPAVTMPDALSLSFPVDGAVLPITSLAFAWTGSTPGDTAHIEMTIHELVNTWSEHYRVRCEVADDGEFEIATAVMEALPAGWYVEASVWRERLEAHPMSGDLDFLARAASSCGQSYQLEE